ncbi:MAG: hypothetical protein ACLP5H_02300 [Desulfomonilaceae bacterium]
MKFSPEEIERKKCLAQTWLEYGERYAVFRPEDQPNPDVWEPDIPAPDAKGRTDPDALKVWYLLPETVEFLEARYGIPCQGATFVFDCPVRKLQGRVLFHDRAETRYWAWKGDLPWINRPKDDDPAWYEKAIRVSIGKNGELGFSCTSQTCFRMWCALHVNQKRRLENVDIYKLVQVFEALPRARNAKKIVADYFGVKLAKFNIARRATKKKQVRYKVSKEGIYDLIALYGELHRKDIQRLLDEVRGLIRASPLVEYHGRTFSPDHVHVSRSLLFHDTIDEMGAAIKLFLFLLIRQEEEASHNRSGVRTSTAQLSKDSGIPRPTLIRYRNHLCSLGYLSIREGVWTVHYNKLKVVDT